MDLAVGATVVHPQHGPATVEQIEIREFGGKKIEYVVLRRPEEELTLKVPSSQVEVLGVRAIVDESKVDEVLAVLRDTPANPKESWRVQRARNQSRLSSGEVREVAAAVRDLAHRAVARGLSSTDLSIQREARLRLLGELTAATGKDDDAVRALIEDALGLEKTAA